MTRRWLYPVIIYLASVAVGFIYIIRYPNYLSLNDLVREYGIYSSLIGGGNLSSFWHVAPFGLQSSCLSTTLIPALLQRDTHIDPLLFYKLFTVFSTSFLPLVIYFIAKKFVTSTYAFVAVVFFMGQIVSLNAPSTARTNIAVLFFALSLLVFLTPTLKSRVKYPLLVILAGAIVVSHYSVAYASLFMLGVMLIAGLIAQTVRKVTFSSKVPIIVTCLSLAVGISIWYALVTQMPWNNAVDFVKNVVTMNFSTVGSGNSITDINSRDAIIQVAFGVRTPGGFSFTWAAWAINWLVIVAMSYGLLVTTLKWRKDKIVPLEYLILSIVGYFVIVAMVVIPNASRAYGIERVYFQMTVFLSVYFVLGAKDMAGRLKQKAYIFVVPMLVLYYYFTYIVGIIHWV